MEAEEQDETKLVVRAAAEVAVTDRLAVAKNVATNGRLFCIMVAAADIAAGHPALAVLMALPVGASVLLDQLPAAPAKSFLVTGVYSFAALVAAVSFFLAW